MGPVRLRPWERELWLSFYSCLGNMRLSNNSFNIITSARGSWWIEATIIMFVNCYILSFSPSKVAWKHHCVSFIFELFFKFYLLLLSESWFIVFVGEAYKTILNDVTRSLVSLHLSRVRSLFAVLKVILVDVHSTDFGYFSGIKGLSYLVIFIKGNGV